MAQIHLFDPRRDDLVAFIERGVPSPARCSRESPRCDDLVVAGYSLCGEHLSAVKTSAPTESATPPAGSGGQTSSRGEQPMTAAFSPPTEVGR